MGTSQNGPTSHIRPPFASKFSIFVPNNWQTQAHTLSLTTFSNTK